MSPGDLSSACFTTLSLIGLFLLSTMRLWEIFLFLCIPAPGSPHTTLSLNYPVKKTCQEFGIPLGSNFSLAHEVIKNSASFCWVIEFFYPAQIPPGRKYPCTKFTKESFSISRILVHMFIFSSKALLCLRKYKFYKYSSFSFFSCF